MIGPIFAAVAVVETVCLCLAYRFGRLAGILEANRAHLQWLIQMDALYGPSSSVFREEIGRLAEEELPYYPDEEDWMDDE